MNLKKMWKRFWNLNVHNHEGFTLVELIIVIAILAILSSVAVVGYSSYIKKANEGADKATLAQLNNAFALACANNGQDHFFAQEKKPKITLTDGKVTNLDLSATDLSEEIQNEIVGDFTESVKDLKFNNITELQYNKDLGQFEEGVNINGVTISKSDLDAMMKTVWFSGDMSAEDLMGIFNIVKDAATSGPLAGVMDGFVADEDFFKIAAKALGYEYGTQEWTDYYDSRWRAEMANVEGANASAKKANAIAKVNADLAVLVAAKNAGSVDVEEFLANYDKNTVLNGTEKDPATLSNLTLAYGLYNAWVYSNPDITDKESELALGTAFDDENLKNQEFLDWVAGPEGQNHLDGLLAMMDTITGQDKDATQDIFESGMDIEDILEELLKQG